MRVSFPFFFLGCRSGCYHWCCLVTWSLFFLQTSCRHSNTLHNSIVRHSENMESVRERSRLILLKNQKCFLCWRVWRETSCFASCFRITSPASITSWACLSERSSPLQMLPSSTGRCFSSPPALTRRVQPCRRWCRYFFANKQESLIKTWTKKHFCGFFQAASGDQSWLCVGKNVLEVLLEMEREREKQEKVTNRT